MFAAMTGAPLADLCVTTYPWVVWVCTSLGEQTKYDKFPRLAVAAKCLSVVQLFLFLKQ